ncbi:MAG: type II/IV secretion system protein [Clostridia bacterium]|jgi:type IV pilus assembly protein PilB|nr:type II/IV secretion system protein [Clostridia bacterium]MBP8633780.1 type II/IV secretion system protein [Clostridia bacterium]MBP9921550.1 type II/IV secretion system protein [Clostridia bacterium]CDC06433.1 type II secretion system protein E [Clostridium sp. CAG:343]HCF35084.1 type II/IV secretion system protein [Clostridiales bacterium]
MDMRKRQPIGVELVKRGIVTEKDIEKALEYQREHPNRKLGDILYILDVCDPNKLIETIGEIVGTKGILLNASTIKVKLTDYISLDIAKKNKAIPFEVASGKIKVCFANTVNSRVIDTVRLLLLNKGLVMESYITFESDIDKILKSLEGVATSNLEAAGRNDTITGLVDSIIKTGMERRASDIHIEPMQNQVRVRYRIDGELFTAAKIEKEKQSQIIGRLKAISNMHQEKQESQDGRILLYEDYNIRVSSQPNIYGEKFVLRLLKKNTVIRNIFKLGFPGTEEELSKNINKKNSITIIAAPTGEGKTTSLYSIIDYLNRPEINITTIEDPVEIRIAGLNQIEIDNRSSFSGSLRTVLRQDPDIILVGEIRDRETGEIAIQAGQTGHYVLSTIHTIDSIEVITRLRKMGLSDYDISSTLATSISQRLVRRLCPECKRERDYTEEEKRIIETISKKYGVEFDLSGKTYDAIGCKHCNNTGYYDRIGIFEMLEITDEIKQEIMNGKSSIEIRNEALKQKYKPLVVDGIRKIVQGYTTLEELNKKLLIY